MSVKVLHLSTFNSQGGGSGRAAESLHRAQVRLGIDSTFWSASGWRYEVARRADKALWRLTSSPLKTWRSPGFFGSLDARAINNSSADVVHLHWVTNGFLSISQIAEIKKPTVWSLYDMWPFSGSEHYPLDEPNARWRDGYTRTNRPADERGIDLDRIVWERKRRIWKPSHIFTASEWMSNAVKSSALFSGWPCARIPHPIDTNMFAPMEKSAARSSLRWQEVRPTLLFLSSAGTRDDRKGFDLLEGALPQVRQRFPNALLVIVGPRDETETFGEEMGIYHHGTVQSDDHLRILYSAADVVVVPSRHDNMPLVAMEAQACGRPVVAFSVGGLADIVMHERTGYLAGSFDVQDLAMGIIRAIQGSGVDAHWGANAHERANTQWSAAVIAQAYMEAYERLI